MLILLLPYSQKIGVYLLRVIVGDSTRLRRPESTLVPGVVMELKSDQSGTRSWVDWTWT